MNAFNKDIVMATSIRLDPESEQRLVRQAAQTGHTKANCVRELATNGPEDLDHTVA